MSAVIAELEVAHMRVLEKRTRWAVDKLNALIEYTERSIRCIYNGTYPTHSQSNKQKRIAMLQKENDERRYERDLLAEALQYFQQEIAKT